MRFSGLDLDGPRGAVAKAHLEGMQQAREVLVPVANEIALPYEDGQRFGDPMDWTGVGTAVQAAVEAYSQVVDEAVRAAGDEHNRDVAES